MKQPIITPRTMAVVMALAMTCHGMAASADDKPDDIYDYDLEQLLQIKVETLNKRPQHFLELPAATTVIDRQEIERSGALTIPDLLARVPGVFVKQVSSNGSVVAIRDDIQTLNTNLLVLIDGNPYYNQATANVLWSSLPIAVEDIERIEVIRGDGGTTWGTNSSNGVINIITRSPDSEPKARVNGGGGINTPFRIHAVTSTGTLRLSAHGEHDQGWQNDPADYTNGYLSGRYDATLSKWNLCLTGRFFDQTATDMQGAFTGTIDNQRQHGYDTGITLDRWFGDDKLQFKGFFYSTVSDFATAEATDIRQQLGDVEIRYNHLFSQGHKTQVAMNYRHYLSKIPTRQYMRQRNEKTADSLINLTLDHESRLTDATTINLGLRYERFTLLEDADGLFSYSLRLAHRINSKTTAWGSFNKSYQFPSYLMTQISTLSGVSGNTVYFQTGNPALDPEDNHSGEIGIRALVGTGLFVDASAFYSRTADEIIIDSTRSTVHHLGPITRIDLPYTNHMKSRLWGTELTLGWDVNQSLHTDLGFTWFHRQSEEQDDIYRGAINDQYAPDYKITLNSRYKFNESLEFSLFCLYEPAHNMSSELKYSPPARTDAHFRADGSLHYRFNDQGTLSLGLKNFFNSGTEWAVPIITIQPVRVEPSLFLNLKYQW